MKCILLLSDKSSGSSAVQREFTRHTNARHVTATPHNEHETLYWVKAAALMGLPQVPMQYSRAVPYASAAAREALIRLVRENVPTFAPPNEDEAFVFQGWHALCEAHAPVFFEKSPHHLHQRSALELMAEAVRQLPDVEFYFIGLVRNPMDTLYSMWSRWRYIPEKRQHEWIRAYRNLLQFRQQVGGALKMVRYEDVVTEPEGLQDLFSFCGIKNNPAPRTQLHTGAMQKWRADPWFGFQPSSELMGLAAEFGYTPSALANPQRPLWPAYRTLKRTFRSGRESMTRLRKRR